MKIGLETERAILRMFTIEDRDALSTIGSNPQVMKYIGLECNPFSREEIKDALITIINHWKTNGFGRGAIISKEANKWIGYAGLRLHEGTAELVYLLRRTFLE
jgi:[ribosomal protein S5]-alanine N-acetyltransferase